MKLVISCENYGSLFTPQDFSPHNSEFTYHSAVLFSPNSDFRIHNREKTESTLQYINWELQNVKPELLDVTWELQDINSQMRNS